MLFFSRMVLFVAAQLIADALLDADIGARRPEPVSPATTAARPSPSILPVTLEHLRFELVVSNRQGWQSPLRRDDVIRLYDPLTHDELGEFSGDLVYTLLAHHLSEAALQAHLTGQLEGRIPVGQGETILPAPVDPPPAPAPPAHPVSAEARRQLRAARQRRGGPARGPAVLPSRRRRTQR